MEGKAFTPLLIKLRCVQTDGISAISMKKTRSAKLLLTNHDNGQVVIIDDFNYDRAGQYEGCIWLRTNALNPATYSIHGYAIDYYWNKIEIGTHTEIRFSVTTESTETYLDFGQVSCVVTQNEEQQSNSPYIGTDGYWYVWNNENNVYVNSGWKATPDIPSWVVSGATFNNKTVEPIDHTLRFGRLVTKVMVNNQTHNPDETGLVDLGIIKGGGEGSLSIIDFDAERELDNLDRSVLARYVNTRSALIRNGQPYGYGTVFAYDEDDEDWYPMVSDTLGEVKKYQVSQITSQKPSKYERLCDLRYGTSMILAVTEEVNGVEKVDNIFIGSYSTPKVYANSIGCFAMEPDNYGINHLVVEKTQANHPRRNIRIRVAAYFSTNTTVDELVWKQEESVKNVVNAVGYDVVDRLNAVEKSVNGTNYDYTFSGRQESTTTNVCDLGAEPKSNLVLQIASNCSWYQDAQKNPVLQVNGNIDYDKAFVITVDNYAVSAKDGSDTFKANVVFSNTDGQTYQFPLLLQGERTSVMTYVFDSGSWNPTGQTTGSTPALAVKSVIANGTKYTPNNLGEVDLGDIAGGSNMEYNTDSGILSGAKDQYGNPVYFQAGTIIIGL